MTDLAEIQAGYEKFGRTTTWVLRLVVLILLLGGVASGYFYSQNDQRIDDIQAARAESIRFSCEEQNDRHDATIRKLDELIAKSPPERRAEAQERRAGTVLLINALAPERDCERRVRLLLNPAAN